MRCVYLSISWLEMVGAGLKKDLRVSRVVPGGSLNAFLFLLIGVISQRLAMVKKGEQAHLESAVQRIVVCCVREGWIAPEKESIDSLPIGWTVGAMIYFTGEVSGSSPGWPSCAKEKNRRLTWLLHACSPLGSGGYSSVGRAPLLQLGRCDYGLDV